MTMVLWLQFPRVDVDPSWPIPPPLPNPIKGEVEVTLQANLRLSLDDGPIASQAGTLMDVIAAMARDEGRAVANSMYLGMIPKDDTRRTSFLLTPSPLRRKLTSAVRPIVREGVIDMAIKILTAADGYALSVDGAESEYVPYGEGLEVEIGGTNYVTLVDTEGEDGDVVSLLPAMVYEAKAVEAEFEDAEEDDEEEDTPEDGGEYEEDDEEGEGAAMHLPGLLV